MGSSCSAVCMFLLFHRQASFLVMLRLAAWRQTRHLAFLKFFQGITVDVIATADKTNTRRWIAGVQNRSHDGNARQQILTDKDILHIGSIFKRLRTNGRFPGFLGCGSLFVLWHFFGERKYRVFLVPGSIFQARDKFIEVSVW